MDYEAAACWVNEYADVLEDLANHRLAGEAEEHAIKDMASSARRGSASRGRVQRGPCEGARVGPTRPRCVETSRLCRTASPLGAHRADAQ